MGLDYVYRDALISLAASKSQEPDYLADSASVDVAQDFFGGMTTLNLGYSRGWDTVGKRGSPSFAEPADHWQYRLGVTQILTPQWVMSANLEAISDDGYLGSPYRAARVFGAAVPERDPAHARSSRALALRAVGSLDSDSAVRAVYRYFWDTWAIRANTLEVGYSRYVQARRWLLDGYLRYYKQDGRAPSTATISPSDMTYMSRNRQLSTFHDLGVGAQGHVFGLCACRRATRSSSTARSSACVSSTATSPTSAPARRTRFDATVLRTVRVGNFLREEAA